MRRTSMNPQFPGRPPQHSGGVALAVAALLAGGCANDSPNLPPLSDTPTGSFLAVASSDFSVGALHSIDLSTLAVRKNLDVLDAQPVVRAFGSQLYVIDQTHGSLRTYDLGRDFASPTDSPLGKNPELPAAQANPYDLYVDAARGVAYVSLYGGFGSTAVTGKRAVGVVDLQNPAAGIVRFIPIPVASADTDNNPEASRLVACPERDLLLLLLQDLDRNSSYAPVGPGRLALIDLKAPTTSPSVSIIQLAGQNPTSLAALPGCTEAIVGSAGDQLSGSLSGTAGIERVDLVGKQSRGLILKDSDLGGNVSTMDSVDARAVFVAVSSKSGSQYNNDVYLVDAVAGTRSQKLLGPIPFIPSLRVVKDRLVVLGSGTAKSGQLATGLYLGPASGAALPTTPIDLGIPPISVDAYTR